jgi:DUF971 family protein
MYSEQGNTSVFATDDEPVRQGEDYTSWPSTIELHKSSRTVELVWNDARAAVSHRELRLACRCAECESARRQGKPRVPIPDEVELLRMDYVGETGLRFFFSDGHDRGIFPWPYLFGLAFARRCCARE